MKGNVTEEPVAGNPHGGFCEGERVKSQDMCILRHITGNGDTGLRRNLKLFLSSLLDSWSKNIKYGQLIRSEWESNTLFLRIQSGLILISTVIFGLVFHFFIGLAIFS